MATFYRAENLALRYRPFPIGRMEPAVDDDAYAEMLAAWPALELFEHQPANGHKYTLGRTCHGPQYRRFVRETPIWSRFDAWIHSDDFVTTVMESLAERHVDLGHRPRTRAQRALKNLKALARGRPPNRGAKLETAWEFQMIPADGGYLIPHTDAPSKIVTMTLSICAPGEWDTSWGGGIDIGAAREDRHAFNQLNRQADFDELEWVDTFEFTPNSGVVFVKTFNSWHAVRPIRGPEGVMRRNLVINIRQP